MPKSLTDQARGFASDLSSLLNNTVCNGVRISSISVDGGVHAVLGRSVSKARVTGESIHLRGCTRDLYLSLIVRLALDPESTYLAVAKSSFGVYLDAEMNRHWFRYDFEREPDKPYPEAHFHVSGLHHDDAALPQLDKLHFPVGGRRFRPVLEDVIEFLILEGLVEPSHPEWQATIEHERRAWYERQLRAAIRRDPEIARRMLSELDG